MKQAIISNRYLNDGISLMPLSAIQKTALKRFLEDPRTTYKTITRCPLCNDARSILIAQKERYGIPLDTVVCKRCGLVRSLQQLSEESTRIFYSEYYRSIYEPLESGPAKERYRQGELKKIPKYVTKDKVVVELGCGGGWNLAPFHDKGYTYYGFDVDEDFIEWGRAKGLNLYGGSTEKIKKMGIRCDYLLINQVLEHVSNPIRFLQEIQPILNKNALVNIYVPSLDLLLWGYSDYDLLGTLQNAHNFLFDEFTLNATAALAGFKTVNCIAGNIVLKREKRMVPRIQLSRLKRGKKIVRYLKFTEKSLTVRKKIGIERIFCKKFYCLLKPVGCYKRFAMEYLGKV